MQSDGVRLVHGESDGLPGLIVDRYGDTLVAQFTSAGTERWRAVIADALLQATGLTRLYERSDASVRAPEGLEPATGWLRGGPVAGGEAPPVELTIHEHQWQLTLNIAEGHKTGFYLDQRDSRKRFADYARRLGFQRVLNCFATPAASAWPRWRACARRRQKAARRVVRWSRSIHPVRRWSAHGRMWRSMVLT